MLRLLRIRNFAIIDELELELTGGFNAITGETGAGKSIILDAISLVLGNRANNDVIRSGSEEATVEALFDIGPNELLVQKLEAHGIEAPENEVAVRRTIHRSGKNKIFVNGELVTLSQLGDICSGLVELCSQHEHQSLSKPSFQLDLLDRYGGLTDRRREVRETASALRSAQGELSALLGDDRERARTEDFLRFQLSEIAEFDPKEGEEEELVNERRRLLNSTHLVEAVNQAVELLDGDGDAARNLVARATQKLSKALQLDEGLQEASAALERSALELEDAVARLNSYAGGLEVDPGRLDVVEDRLTRLGELKRKYGASIAEIRQAHERIEEELGEFAHRQERVSELETRIAELKADYEKAARDLSKRRKNVAKTLKESIRKELAELMMPATRFEIEFAELDADHWGAEGIDKVQFLFSPNAGEDLKPVSKIASGGELSRVMLAIRRTIADRGNISVYLFDEIDAGIGGQTATVVGKKLQSVGKYNQVICITHLPQVAAFAAAHYSVSKAVVSGRTVSQIVNLTGNKRVDELARMLGGIDVTDKSRAHAKDLLKQAGL